MILQSIFYYFSSYSPLSMYYNEVETEAIVRWNTELTEE